MRISICSRSGQGVPAQGRVGLCRCTEPQRQRGHSMRFRLSGCAAEFESLLPTQWPVFAQMAETAGFESLWFNEEHFQRPHDSSGRFCFSPLIAAAQLAAHTQRIRIGFSVLLLPLHHPVRLAEELATLDVMNGGGSISACREEAIGTTRRRVPDRFRCRARGVSARPRYHVVMLGTRRNSSERRIVRCATQTGSTAPSPVYIGTYNEETAGWAAREGHRLIQHGVQ